ncbi:MAG: hypothetical protein ABEI31_01420 [Halodesulfurarchaeum sp.]
MNPRDLLAGLGVLLGSAGLLAALAPGTVLGLNLAVLPLPLVGLGALLLALGGYVARRRATGTRASPPSVEERVSVSEPGVEADESLRTAAGVGLRATSERATIEDRLRETAIDVLMATRGCDRAAAIEHLEDGTWTDDQRASAFFQTEPPETPLRDVIRGVITGRSQFSRNARHVIGALDAELREITRERADMTADGKDVTKEGEAETGEGEAETGEGEAGTREGEDETQEGENSTKEVDGSTPGRQSGTASAVRTEPGDEKGFDGESTSTDRQPSAGDSRDPDER